MNYKDIDDIELSNAEKLWNRCKAGRIDIEQYLKIYESSLISGEKLSDCATIGINENCFLFSFVYQYNNYCLLVCKCDKCGWD